MNIEYVILWRQREDKFNKKKERNIMIVVDVECCLGFRRSDTVQCLENLVARML